MKYKLKQDNFIYKKNQIIELDDKNPMTIFLEQKGIVEKYQCFFRSNEKETVVEDKKVKKTKSTKRKKLTK